MNINLKKSFHTLLKKSEDQQNVIQDNNKKKGITKNID